MRRSFLAFFSLILLLTGVLLAPATPSFALPGQVLAEQKISSTSGGFGGVLSDQDQFGASVTLIGDLNGDTVGDLLVGAARDGDGGSGAGAAWVLFMQAAGTVGSQAKISATTGGLVASLDAGDQFGMAVAGIGDLDGDAVPDVVVGADGDDDGGSGRGAVYVLFLNSNGTVKDEQKISSTSGGFAGPLANGDGFGSSVVSLGDLDGDDIVDIAVGAPLTAGGGAARGAVWILFLNSNGTVKSSTRIDDTTGGLAGSLADLDLFGISVSVLRDLDGDNVDDLVVGAEGDSENGSGRGAVWILNLDAGGGVVGAQKINGTNGGFGGTLDNGDAFGASVGAIPDLDGDGIDDLGVGATGDDTGGFDRGNIYILFLNSNSTVKNFRRINAPGSGFVGPLLNTEMFGNAVTQIRDLDGDLIPDIVGGLRFSSDGGANRGAIYVMFMDGVPGSLCGDGLLDPGEDCDDGNDDNNDCCDDSCMFEPSGTPCSDGDVCDGEEMCDGAGSCLPGLPLDCQDGQACTQDTCDPILGCETTTGPAVGCRLSGKVSLVIGDKDNDSQDKLNWKWLKGDETLFSDFGDPFNNDTYAVCVYDTIADVPSLAMELVVPPSVINWSVRGGNKGFKYKDSAAIEDGARSITMAAGDTNKAKVIFKAKGVATPLPGPVGVPYFDQDSSLIVQLLNNTSGICWSSDLATPALKNDPENFKDKFP